MILFVATCVSTGANHKNSGDAASLISDPAGWEQTAAPRACRGATVTSGIGLAWKWLNHRISWWEVHPEWKAAGADAGLVAGYVGGNWSTGETFQDTPLVRYRYARIQAGDAAAFTPVAVKLLLAAPVDEARQQFSFALDDLELDGYDRHFVFLQGLTLNSAVEQHDPAYPADYGPALGYTSRGIGAGIENVAVADGRISFTAYARFDLGPADRRDMNEAIAHAETEAIVHALVMGMHEGAVTGARVHYRLEYHDPLFLFQPNYAHAAPEFRRQVIQGAPSMPTAFVAMRSFNFALFDSTDKGEYLRELSALAQLVTYDAETGRALLDVDGFASNASLLTYERMENDFSMELALVQLPGGEATIGHVTEEFGVGRTRLPLP